MPSAEPAARLVTELGLRAPTLGAGRLLSIDGPAGSGKTTLAAAVVPLLADRRAALVHMDDLYDGWNGLSVAHEQLATLVRPLAVGEPGRYRRYDWAAGRFAESVVVAPCDVLVLEGVGAGHADIADLITVLAWVEADETTRLRRGLARDGVALRDEWLRWMELERAHFRRDRTRDRADLCVDGHGVPIVGP